MSDWEDWEEESEEDLDEDCLYGVCEPCAHPQTRAMGLCTTECSAYFDAVEAEEKERVDKEKKIKGFLWFFLSKWRIEIYDFRYIPHKYYIYGVGR